MIVKVISLAVVFVAVSARPQGGEGGNHDHDHAFSSQTIKIHHGHHEPVYIKHKHEPVHHEQKHQEAPKHEEKKHEEHHQPAHHKKHSHGHHESQGHEHGHAFSSQSINVHHGHHEPTYIEHKYEPVHHEHKHHEASKHEEKKLEEHHEHHHVDYYTHPKYEYEYKVEDPHTHDQKQHHETRNGDTVYGFYSLREADGTVRIVEYTADKHTGFHADVRHEGHPKYEAPEHHHHQ